MRFEQAKDLLRALEREGVRYVLVGPMAMAAQGIVRATRDIDFSIAPDEENVERVKRALRAVFRDESIDEISSADLSGSYPVIRYGPPNEDYVIDLLARLGEAFTFENIDSEELFVEGIAVRVATPSMLYRMKRSTARPQDRLDAESLASAIRTHRRRAGVTVRTLKHLGQVTLPDATPLDENNLRSAIELSELCLRLRPLTPPRGVRRFASIEDAHKHRVQWEIDPLAS